ncbi:MAG: hypothetical protein K0S88_2634 [Actinomycetia bacterium]|jgi:hypothetical protein|nr:hypothetical protein [Actinomycetes bacterium]
MDAPILLVVDEDQAVLEALSGDLGRRFGVDYRILTESARRPAARPPLFLETSLPGVFAARGPPPPIGQARGLGRG